MRQAISCCRRLAFYAAAILCTRAPPAAVAKSRDRYPIQEIDGRPWADVLSSGQYFILRQGGTEPPFSSPLVNEKRRGVYVCAGCVSPLFDSTQKFDSGTGWPSFAYPRVNVEAISGFLSSEARCGQCGGHLGDIFSDGAKYPGTRAAETGQRYCIDGAALVFVPSDAASGPIAGDGLTGRARLLPTGSRGKEAVLQLRGGAMQRATRQNVQFCAVVRCSCARGIAVCATPQEALLEPVVAQLHGCGIGCGTEGGVPSSVRRALIVGGAGVYTSCVASHEASAAAAGAVVVDEDESQEARLAQLLVAGGALGARLSKPQAAAAEALIEMLEARGGTQLGAATGEGLWELPFMGGWDVLLARPSFVGGPAGGILPTGGGKTGRLALFSARQFIWGPGEGGTTTECVYSSVAESGSAEAEAIVLTRTGSVINLPATDLRLDFATPVSARRAAATITTTATVAAAPPLGSLVLPESVGLVSPAGGALLRRTTYLSERLWVTRSSDDGGLAVLRRTDADALHPPSRKLYGKVYSLRYSD